MHHQSEHAILACTVSTRRGARSNAVMQQRNAARTALSSASLSGTDARTTHSYPFTFNRVDLRQNEQNIQPPITMPAPVHALMEFPAAGYDCLGDAHTPLGSSFSAAEPHHQELVVAQLMT